MGLSKLKDLGVNYLLQNALKPIDSTPAQIRERKTFLSFLFPETRSFSLLSLCRFPYPLQAKWATSPFALKICFPLYL